MSDSNYTSDRAWSDRFLNHARSIVGFYATKIAPDFIDKTEAADLMIESGGRRTAVRIRRPGFSDAYKYQITLRSSRATGANTELSKIIDGHGDWLLYGHADSAQNRFAQYILIDLRVLRRIFIRSPDMLNTPNNISSGYRNNSDSQTGFFWLDVRYFPSDLVIGSSLGVIERLEIPVKQPESPVEIIGSAEALDEIAQLWPASNVVQMRRPRLNTNIS